MRSETELLTAAYEAFNRRDIDAVLALMKTDVDWPNGMEGGRVHGREEVRVYWIRQWEIMDPHVEPVRITQDEAGNWVVDVHQVVRDLAGNVLADRMAQHVYAIPAGLIERMEIRNPD